MDIERYAHLNALFDQLIRLPAGAARDARLTELCGDDDELRAELERLLRCDAEEDELSPGAILRSDLEAAWEREGAILEDRDAEVPARYQILHLLGQGGFGSVYLAREEEPFPRLVAIKLIKPGMDSREVLARFDSERRALASMDHPGIARAYTTGTDQRGRPYFVMEYVEGQSITTFCDEQQLDLRRRLDLFLEVCEAIQHAHFKGIVHRDIKPANVLVTESNGRPCPKTIDFGIAKALEQTDDHASLLTREGQLVGTPAAMSPEQALGTAVDTRTDVYGLGGLLYELLCGVPPVSNDSENEDLDALRRRIIEVDPPRPSSRARGATAQHVDSARQRGVSPSVLERTLADDLDWIVMKALEKDPERRYASPNELAADIRRYLTSEPVQARPPSRSYQAARFARRHRAGLVAASTIATLLIAGTIGTSVGWRRSLNSLAIAQEQEARALRNLERARIAEADALAINGFLNDDLLSAASPEFMGYSVSMRQVLDAAAERVEGRFDENPRVERAIRTTLGRTYRALSLNPRALEQLEAALAIEVPVAGSELDSEEQRAEQKAADVRARGLAQYEIGRVYLQEGRNEEAERVLRELWGACSSTLGDLDPLTIDALHYVGVALAEQNHLDEASDLFDLTRAQALEAFGPNHALSIQSLHSQGLVRLSAGPGGAAGPGGVSALDETTALLQEAVQASRAFHGSDDPRTVRRIVDLAMVRMGAKQLDEALSLFEEAYERSARVQGPDHPTTAVSALNIGECQVRQGDFDAASDSFEEALRIATGLVGAGPLLADVQLRLAKCRVEQRRLEEAEQLARAALETEKSYGGSIGAAARLLAGVCEQLGRGEEAQQWRRVAAGGAAEPGAGAGTED